MFNVDMLSLLVCPVSQLTLSYDAERQLLISEDGQYEYPIINGIPVLLPHNTMEE